MKIYQKTPVVKYLSGLAALFLLLAVTSCKKSSGSGEEDNGSASNTFSLDGKTYADPKVYYNENDVQLTATHTVTGSPFNTVNTVIITFSGSKMPSEGGTFDIVNDPSGNAANKELSILFTSFPYNYGSYYDRKRYFARTDPRQKATVSVDANKKVTVKFSNIVVTNNIDASTTTASGTIIQP